MEMTRLEAVNKIKHAYENKLLGFQNQANKCLYYDHVSNSHCAVGVLIGKDKELMRGDGSIESPFKRCGGFASINNCMDYLELNEWNGLTIGELSKLQGLHDSIINCSSLNYDERHDKFKDFLYNIAV